jgi:hypothetical protein
MMIKCAGLLDYSKTNIRSVAQHMFMNGDSCLLTGAVDRVMLRERQKHKEDKSYVTRATGSLIRDY